jgi:hypothetical protein
LTQRKTQTKLAKTQLCEQPKRLDLTAMPNPTEQARLDQIEAALAVLADQAAPLKAEKAAILSRVRQRGHYARQKPATQS